jgi:ATP-GRASP peptide maturase of grasp-with-spasm system
MILIISENNDFFTDQVIEWLSFFKIEDIIRINEDDKINIKEINIQENKIIIETNEKEIDLSKIDYFWYRRSGLNHSFNRLIDFEKNTTNDQIVKFLDYEWLMCRNYIFYCLQTKESIGNFFRAATNKLVNLKIAKECGLGIPDTYISESISDIINIEEETYITKPIGEAMTINKDDGVFTMFTKKIEKTDILGKEHFPTLCQQKINKHFEIRTFVLLDEIYSMAIFSQKNEHTNVDYRNYDFNKMNRMIPYKLPIEIEKNILNFMKKVGLNTGSIDLIKTHNNQYVFLEVNPAGNIEMVNSRCNYMLDKRIAEIIKTKVENDKR